MAKRIAKNKDNEQTLDDIRSCGPVKGDQIKYQRVLQDLQLDKGKASCSVQQCQVRSNENLQVYADLIRTNEYE